MPKEDETSNEAKKAAAIRSGAFIAILILVIGITSATMFGRAVYQQSMRDHELRLSEQTNSVTGFVNERLNAYDNLLRTGVAIVNQKPEVSREMWLTLSNDLNIDQRYPNVIGFGYVTVLAPESVESFEQSRRAEGITDFTVHPLDGRPQYTTITYLYPEDTQNQKAIGFDMSSNDVRREAMDRARDTGISSISAPVALVQASDNPQKQVGVLVYSPVYRGAATSTAERRAALIGYVYIVVRPGDIMNRFMSQSPQVAQNYDLELTDTTSSPGTSLYKLRNTFNKKASSEKVQDISVFERTWTLTLYGENAVVSRLWGPIAIVALGSLLSIGLAVTIYLGVLSHISRVTTAYDKEVQRTKDELLALASHQLRTPASGVKQYLGMLDLGLIGKLTPKQKEIIRKAYHANERQLAIINELLYVSKADAGQLKIEPREIDLTALTKQVVDGFTAQAEAKQIALSYRNMTPRITTIDDRFGRMIIENLVSNAIKYSFPGSTVTIRLKDIDNFVALSVSDRGVGIAAEDLPDLFGKFNRIHNELSHSEGGSGLGLFLAKRLAEAHGGDIRVESTLGEGSTFTLLVPKHTTIASAAVSLRHAKKGVSKN